MEGVTPLIEMPEIMILGFVVASLLIYFGLKSFRTAKAIRLAKWIIENQTERASNTLIEQWIISAELCGRKEIFMRHLIKIRTELGHSNVKIGHLAYIDHLIDSELDVNPEQLPRFNKNDGCENNKSCVPHG